MQLLTKITPNGNKYSVYLYVTRNVRIIFRMAIAKKEHLDIKKTPPIFSKDHKLHIEDQHKLECAIVFYPYLVQKNLKYNFSKTEWGTLIKQMV